jgi:oligopeptidase B
MLRSHRRAPSRHSGALVLIALSLTAAVAMTSCATTTSTKGEAPMSNETSTSSLPAPPVAARIEHRTEIHDRVLIDPYFWMRDRENPETLAYLEAENAYTSARMAHTEPLQQTIYDEILARIQQTDLTVPVRHGDYYYYSRTEEGKDYPIFCRKPQSLDNEEQIILDVNALAEGHDYFSIGALEVSDDHRLLAYSVDTRGDERYSLYFKNLETGELIKDAIENTAGVVWANDNVTVFYTTLDATNRPDKVYRHRLGTANSEDVLIHHEQDEGFYTYLSKTRSSGFILVTLGTISSTEVRYLDANAPTSELKILSPRQPGVEYSVEHHDDRFFIITNEDAINFRMMSASVDAPAREQWQEVIPHRDDVMLESAHAFKDWLVILEREGGVSRVRVRHLPSGEEHHVAFPEDVYELRVAENPEFDSNDFRMQYSSLVTPRTVFDYQMPGRELELMKETEVKQYDRAAFETHRIFATAADGTQIPISLVYKKGLALNGSNPTLLVGYGSYGANYDPYFSATRISLLERGVIYAIAHIRGGSEMGRMWYENGKMLHKKNTFTDFIASAEHLIEQGYTSAERLAINGGSAGGLLMGAVVNARPDLFAAVVADVPFVDVINTMLDPSIPLTVIEYNEWGNPNEREYFDYIASYAPYENVVPQAYPPMLITAGLNDPRVHYWEPAKWTAKLRATKTDDNVLLLKTNMGAGHGGASGRYEWFRETAFTYAFILDQLGVR